jgi:hypothetical protein
MKKKFHLPIRIQRLHLYTDDTDTYIAFDEKDAEKLWEENCDIRLDEELNRVKDTQRITYSVEPEEYNRRDYPFFAKIERTEFYVEIAMPAWAWALQNGRGFFCTTEF